MPLNEGKASILKARIDEPSFTKGEQLGRIQQVAEIRAAVDQIRSARILSDCFSVVPPQPMCNTWCIWSLQKSKKECVWGGLFGFLLLWGVLVLRAWSIVH